MATQPVDTRLRKTGIGVVGDVPWGSHFLLFYETKEDLLDTLVPYFKAGLENGEFCLLVVSEPLTEEEVRNAMREAVPEFDRYLAEGSIEILPGRQVYFSGHDLDLDRVLRIWAEKLDSALARGYAGLRVSANTSWLERKDRKTFCDYENEVNNSINNWLMTALCTYPLAGSAAAEILDVVRTHQFAVARRNKRWEVVETSELNQAKSEIKRLNDELERRVAERTEQLETVNHALEVVNDALRREIANHRRAEEALRRSEDRLRLVIDTLPAMVWSKLPDGSADFLNQRFREYTGLSVEEGLGHGWLRAIHPDDPASSIDEWRAAFASAKPFEFEARLRRADGEYHWFLLRGAPLRDERGKIVKWYGKTTDIEDRKLAEERSRALIDAIPQQIWSGPSDGSLDFCNARWRSYMGLTLEELQGEGWQSMLHPDDRERVLKAWRESVTTGTPYEQEERHRGADGQYHWFLARALPLRDSKGLIVRWYGTNTDIEDRKRAEAALQEAHANLARVSGVVAMGELAAAIAHEVNQPLAAIVTNANFCLRQLTGAETNIGKLREVIWEIANDGTRASAIISRIRALLQKGVPERVEIDVNQIIEEVAVLLRDKLIRNRVSLRTDLGSDIPRVCGDYVQLQQVLINLVMNGIEAMGSLAHQPRELLVKSARNHNGILIQVQDSGEGLDMQHAERIFEPFFTTKPEGIGMGLSISRSIVESHGGRLWAERCPKGAIFKFTLPAR